LAMSETLARSSPEVMTGAMEAMAVVVGCRSSSVLAAGEVVTVSEDSGGLGFRLLSRLGAREVVSEVEEEEVMEASSGPAAAAVLRRVRLSVFSVFSVRWPDADFDLVAGGRRGLGPSGIVRVRGSEAAKALVLKRAVYTPRVKAAERGTGPAKRRYRP
jgi:hypothetical protein